MLLTYLSGVGRLVRLTKTFTQNADGSVTKSSYPNANRLNSFHDDVQSPEGFLTSLREHASRGHALFTGQLTRQLFGESRKGLATRNNRMPWMCLDFDGADIADLDTFIQSIPGLCDVSYIVAYSASHGFKRGLNAHVFFMLEEPESHNRLVTLVAGMNWHVPELRAQLKLSDTQRTLSKVLDTAGVRPAGLIYLSPPELVGLSDPFASIDDRIFLVKKDRQAVNLSRFPDVWLDEGMVSMFLRKHLNELRDELDLPPVGLTYKRTEVDGQLIEYDIAPGNLRITLLPGPINTNGMVRCNVNGGDSGAYYFNYGPIGDGTNGTVLTLLGNFKGDPPLALAASAPEFTKSWNDAFVNTTGADVPEWLKGFQESVGAAGDLLPPITDAEDHYKALDGNEDDNEDVTHMDEKGKIIFRDGFTGEHYEYNYLAKTGTPFFSKLNKSDAITRARAIGLRYDKERGFPTLWMASNPHSLDLLYDVDGVPMINSFVHPKTIDYKATRDIPVADAHEALRQAAPTIATCIYHALNNDADAMRSFLNWLSVHFTMPKDRVNTAWLLRGVQGSGKSIITSDIMPAILGYGHSKNNVDACLGYCTTVKMATVLDKFSGWQLGKRLVEIEEAEFTGLEKAHRKQGMQEFKRIITRERADVNVKYGGQLTNVRTFAAFIFTTNRPDDFPIEDHDRRFHVPSFQHTPLWDVVPMAKENFNALRDVFVSEAVAAGDVLSRIQADVRLAQTPYDCGDKLEIISANRTGMENFVHMVANGEFDNLAELVVNEAAETLSFTGRYESAAHLTSVKTIAYIAMTGGIDWELPADLLLSMAKALGYASENTKSTSLTNALKAVEVLGKRMRISKGYADMFPEKSTGNAVSHYRVLWKSDNFAQWCEHPILADIIKEQRGKAGVMGMISA